MAKSSLRLVVVLALLYLISEGFLYNRVSAANQKISVTQVTLARTQRELERSAKASAETRVTTVSQRCKFTGLVTNVLVKQDPQVAGPFKKSLAGCMKQLAVVKKIAASAPTSP